MRRDGGTEVGVLPASTREAVSAALTSRGLFPLDIRVDDAGGEWRARTSVADLALGLRVLATLLEAGLPMERALAIFSTLAPRGWAAGAIASIRAAVREGRSLAAAIGAAPIAIPPLVIGMVESGEAGGNLAEAVRRAAAVTEQSAATSAAIRSALTYPAILGIAGMLSVTLLVGVVLPRFAAIVDDLGQELPAAARAILAPGDVVRIGAVPGALLVLGGVVGMRRWLAGSRSARIAWHAALLWVPVVGPIRRAAAASRVTAALSGMLDSGVPIARGLLHSARAAGDAAIEQRLLDVRERVVGGDRLSSALASCDALTASVVQLVRAGEATGRLAPMLDHGARIEREWAEERVKRLVRLIEPGLHPRLRRDRRPHRRGAAPGRVQRETRRMKTRAGFTLIELIVVLVILGIVGAISGAAMRHPPATARTGSREMAIEHIANARRLAVTQGKPVTVTVRISASDSTELLAREVTARPDGSVVADPDLGIDRLSGRPARTDGHRR